MVIFEIFYWNVTIQIRNVNGIDGYCGKVVSIRLVVNCIWVKIDFQYISISRKNFVTEKLKNIF